MTYSLIVIDPPWKYGNRWETRLDGSGKTTYGPGAAGRYPTMSLKEIAAIPIGKLAAPQCLCMLWITGPHMALSWHARCFEAWGFIPATVLMVWIKTNPARWSQGKEALAEAADQPTLWPAHDPLQWILEQQTMDDLTFPGTGNYSFANAEYLLIGRRKGTKKPKRAKDPQTGKIRIFKQILYAPVDDHSAKPQAAYDRLDWSWPPEMYPNRIDVFGRTGRPNWTVIGNEAPETTGEDITQTIERITT
jgi:N6-adenosine-specific RNA methylase IME4